MLSKCRLALAVLALGSMACDSGRTSQPEIRIGVLATLTGHRATTSGRATTAGAELAVKLANDSGGIDVGGVLHRVVLIVRDYPDRADGAAAAARALINQERIDALIGPQFSEHAIPVARLAEKAHLPMISPMSTNPETTSGKDFVFRVAFLDDNQARVMTQFARERLGAARAAVLFNVSTQYSRHLAYLFREDFEDAGGRVVAFENYTSDRAEDFIEQLERIRDAQPDVLYLPNYTKADSIQVTQARSLGIRGTFLGGDTWDMVALGRIPEAQGAFVTHQWNRNLPTDQARRFKRLYQDEYGEFPRSTAAMTFDAIGLLLDAIGRAGSLAPHAMRDAIASTHDYSGVTGSIGYDGSGDPKRSVVISQIRGGQPAFVETVAPS